MTDTAKHAVLTRMVLPDHVCPYGKAALELLNEQGFEVEDRQLTTRAETDAFMAEKGLETTPLIEIDGKPIGGYSELCDLLGAPNAMAM
ncbi:glutaredoxin family protein [Parablastomonas sp. CN1-191]|uniref:glutaredoxin family protein n=1 Tax=Parablastomonas sp. CN1-191 TaxID=3400908 RepID=UPI003BF81808